MRRPNPPVPPVTIATDPLSSTGPPARGPPSRPPVADRLDLRVHLVLVEKDGHLNRIHAGFQPFAEADDVPAGPRGRGGRDLDHLAVRAHHNIPADGARGVDGAGRIAAEPLPDDLVAPLVLDYPLHLGTDLEP